MNIGMNNNYSNRPSFGMAVFLEENADRIIKNQTSKMSKKGYEKFWQKFDGVVDRQKDSPVNIIVRKANYRDALVAEVVDNKADNAIKNYVTAQGLIHRNGSLRFLDRAEKKADRVADANKRLEKYVRPEEKEYWAGGEVPKEIKADKEEPFEILD